MATVIADKITARYALMFDPMFFWTPPQRAQGRDSAGAIRHSVGGKMAANTNIVDRGNWDTSPAAGRRAETPVMPPPRR